MAGMFHVVFARVRRACATAPNARDGADLALAGAAFAGLAALVGAAAGLMHWQPLPASQLALLAVRALFIPALGEELVFRAALVPGRDESVRPFFWMAVSTMLFTGWHIVETTFLPGSAATFLRADFLALAAALGLLCAILRW